MKQFSVSRVVIKIQRGCSVGGVVQLGGLFSWGVNPSSGVATFLHRA